MELYVGTSCFSPLRLDNLPILWIIVLLFGKMGEGWQNTFLRLQLLGCQSS